MFINIYSDLNNNIIFLANKIIQDWSQKITNQVPTQCNLYNVLIVDQRITPDSYLQKKPHLILILQALHMGQQHILALSQQLSTFGQVEKQFVPSFLAQITIANTIAITILQNYQSEMSQLNNSHQKVDKKPKIHKLSCISSLKYFGAFNISSKANGMRQKKRGLNILDGGAPFYAIYPTKKGLLAVGNLQPKFYEEMVQELGLQQQEKQFCLQNQLNFQNWPRLRNIFSNKFMQMSAQQWQNKMSTRDTCITAVRNPKIQAKDYLHPYLIKPKL